jgi:hypothetical protein
VWKTQAKHKGRNYPKGRAQLAKTRAGSWEELRGLIPGVKEERKQGGRIQKENEDGEVGGMRDMG